MRLPPIYAITDPFLLPGNRLYEAVEDALRGGVRLLQLRDKKADEKQLLSQALRLRELCEKYQAQLIINDRVEIARTSEAHGVHLGQTDVSINEAKHLLGARAVIGATCHNDLQLAKQAESYGASYVAFGRFFQSNTKPSAPPADAKILVEAHAQIHVPSVVIGGITLENMHHLIHAGANCLALCHTLFASNDVYSRARTLIDVFHSSKQQTDTL